MSILTLEQRLRMSKIRGAKNRPSTYCFIFKFFPFLSRFLGQVSDRDTGVFLFDLPSDLIKPQHIRRHRSLGSVFVLLGFSFSLPFRFLRLEKSKKGFKIFGITSGPYEKDREQKTIEFDYFTRKIPIIILENIEKQTVPQKSTA